MLRFQGCEHFRQRILLSCLSGKAIRIDDIRSTDEAPGLQTFEASFLRLTEKVSNGCVVDINETGTTLRFRPGVLVGGSGLRHDCGTGRSLAYFAEPLALMALFGKKALDIELRGMTNSPQDVSTDAFRAAALPLLREAGAEATLEVKQRAVGPTGAGVAQLSVHILRAIEKPVHMVDEGLVRRVRGVAWTVNLGAQYAQALAFSAKGVLLQLLADVNIFTDVVSLRKPERASPGYGITLVAETTAGRYITADCCLSGVELLQARAAQRTPEEVGEQAACQLLAEVKRGGIADGAHQALAILLAALGPQELNTVRLGALSMYAIKTLRHVKDMLGIEFDIRPDAESQTISLSCVGLGLRNMSRKVY